MLLLQFPNPPRTMSGVFCIGARLMVEHFSQYLALPFPLRTHQCIETHAKQLRWYLTHLQLHNGFAFMIFSPLSSGLEVSKMLCNLISHFTKDGTSWNCSGRHYLFIHSVVLSGCFSPLLFFSLEKTSSPSCEHSIGARLVFCNVHRINRFFSLLGTAPMLLCCSPGVSPLGFLIWNWHFLG